ncbi:hypothetical protein NQ317_001400 [Molorchus minor]|uniref:Aminopeptidase n=1 Tax=Molorchus minor TaxID=1323400 RepID=A0ABQ9J5G2_9CUCU|nr:hypothetical protein NQ317_001400 [Molorchus minor]
MGPIYFFAFVVAVASADQLKAAAKEDYRLPQIYDISNYELDLLVPTDTFTSKSDLYNGTVKIQLAFTNATDVLYLHAHPSYITLQTVTFNNLKLAKEDYGIDNVTNILKIQLTNPITVNNKYYLIIQFEGRLSTTDMYGFYKSSYVDAKGKTKYLATTQFEPTHARRAFPCFDEPGFKAPFTVSITYPSELNVLFNTQVKYSTNTSKELTSVTFDPTPKMSAYLLAFVVSEFTCSTGDKVGSTIYEVCSRNETASLRDLAVTVGPKMLAALNNLTAIDYGKYMKKLDLAAIPDFSAGAMENWGLNTYREIYLLWDNKESSNKYKQAIATVIAHETTHQWFGDLVTCAWWSETFLNEGFAEYFEYFIAHEVFPEWELDKQFVLEVMHTVLDSDELENTQAIQSDCYTPTEIGNKFGDISYNKGASILRMVSHILGQTNFIAGLRTYLTTNAYAATKPEQLWAALSEHVDNSISNLPADLPTIMNNWITKSGFPLISVTLSGNNLIIKQKRLSLSGNDTTTWYVPITYTISSDSKKFEDTTPRAWLTPDKEYLNITPKENTSWIILNNQESGYYRVTYDDVLWDCIKRALVSENFDGIIELNRAQIVDDLFSLGKADEISYQSVLDITGFLSNDTSYYPWYAAFEGFSFLLRRVGKTSKLGEAVSAYVLGQMNALYESVPFNKLNDSEQVYTLKQVLALTWACQLGHEGCVDEAVSLFADFRENGTKPNKNLRTVVYCNGLRYSSNSTDDWEFLWNVFTESENLATERSTIISALGCTTDTELLKSYLEKTLTDESGIRLQDAASVFSAVYSGNPEGIAVAYDFLTENYTQIAQRYQSMNSLSTLIKGISERFTTQGEVKKLQDFIANGDLPEEFKSSATQAVEIAQSNLKWTEKFEDELMDVFDVPKSAGAVAKSLVSVMLAVGVSLFLVR